MVRQVAPLSSVKDCTYTAASVHNTSSFQLTEALNACTNKAYTFTHVHMYIFGLHHHYSLAHHHSNADIVRYLAAPPVRAD